MQTTELVPLGNSNTLPGRGGQGAQRPQALQPAADQAAHGEGVFGGVDRGSLRPMKQAELPLGQGLGGDYTDSGLALDSMSLHERTGAARDGQEQGRGLYLRAALHLTGSSLEADIASSSATAGMLRQDRVTQLNLQSSGKLAQLPPDERASEQALEADIASSTHTAAPKSHNKQRVITAKQPGLAQ